MRRLIPFFAALLCFGGAAEAAEVNCWDSDKVREGAFAECVVDDSRFSLNDNTEAIDARQVGNVKVSVVGDTGNSAFEFYACPESNSALGDCTLKDTISTVSYGTELDIHGFIRVKVTDVPDANETVKIRVLGAKSFASKLGGGGGVEETPTVAAFEECVERAWGATESYRECRLVGGSKTADWPDVTLTAALDLMLPDVGQRQTLILDFGGEIFGPLTLSAGDADDIYGVWLRFNNVECNGGADRSGPIIEARRLVTQNTIGEKSITWLTTSNSDESNDCSLIVRDSVIGRSAGILAPSLNEEANRTVRVQDDTAINFINTEITAAVLNANEPLISVDANARTQSTMAFTGSTIVSYPAGTPGHMCVEVTATGASGDWQFLFDRSNESGSQPGVAWPWFTNCEGFTLDGGGFQKGFHINGQLRWAPQANTNVLFFQDDTTGGGPNNVIDIELWLDGDGGALLGQGATVNGVDQLHARIFGDGGLTEFVQHGVGTTTTVTNMFINYQAGTTKITCATAFDADADTDYAAANLLLGQIISHDTALGLDYVAGTDCTALY